jgi:hypothetical protein
MQLVAAKILLNERWRCETQKSKILNFSQTLIGNVRCHTALSFRSVDKNWKKLFSHFNGILRFSRCLLFQYNRERCQEIQNFRSYQNPYSSIWNVLKHQRNRKIAGRILFLNHYIPFSLWSLDCFLEFIIATIGIAHCGEHSLLHLLSPFSIVPEE